MAKITSAANLTRVLTIVVGIVALGLGSYSYVKSSWFEYENGYHTKEIYRICDIKYALFNLGMLPKELRFTCPHIGLEKYFISVIAICTAVSLVGILIAFVIQSKLLKFLDVIVPIISAGLIISGAACYIISAKQIDDIFYGDVLQDWIERLQAAGYEWVIRMPLDPNADDVNFRRNEKYAAAGIAIFNGLLYLVTAVLIATQKSSK